MENEEMELDLGQVWRVIKKNLIWFILICLLCGGVAYTYTKLLVVPKYTSTSEIIIVKDSNSQSQAITYSDIQLSNQLGPQYEAIIMSDTVSDEVIGNLGLSKYGITNKQYKKMVSLPDTNSNQVIDISVTTEDPELSAKISNEIVKVARIKITDIMHVDNVTVLNVAKVPTVPSSPNTMTNVAIGVVIGMVICALITIIKVLTDTKIKSEDEVKAILDYPIIATIPEFDTDENKGGNKNVNA